jgi:ribosomal protein S18 acetylase RimI-like enzyme
MALPTSSPPTATTDLPIRRIRLWQHWRAVGQIERDYPPGADAVVDEARSAPAIVHFALRHVLLPLYFTREQGWMIRGPHGELAAMTYLRRQERSGVRVMHVDDINVNARYLRRGLAQRLLRLAEDLAHKERRPFLKLAVTVANTPAVTLYRRVGYKEQHHRYFTFVPPPGAPRSARLGDLSLRRLSRKHATQAFRRFYRIEMTATAPDVADLMVVYYGGGGSDINGPTTTKRAYAIEQNGQVIGYGDVYRQKTRWHLRLSLHPELWAGDVERQAILLMTGVIGRSKDPTITLHVPSAGHFDALSTGPQSLAQTLGLCEHLAARMMMVKPPAGAS